jgi:hypothetical protein
MKKILIICTILFTVTGCFYDETYTADVPISIVLEAQNQFKQDTTLKTIVIQKEYYNFVFEKGKSIPILKSKHDHSNNIIITFATGILIGLILVWIIAES